MAKQGDARITKCREILWAVTFANATIVFAPGHIANPMKTVFYSPVTATQSKQLPGVRPFRTNACNGMRHISRPLAINDACSLDSNRLGESRPREIALQPRTGLQESNLDATVPLVDITNFIKLLTAKTFAVGERPGLKSDAIVLFNSG